jgi:hypothetical protein
VKLPSFRRIYSGDFNSQYKGLLDQLSGTINTGIEALYQVLNNNVSFSDNIACTVATVNVTVDSKGNTVGNCTFKLSNTQPIIGVFPIMCKNNTNTSAAPVGGIFITYTTSSNATTSSNSVVVTNVTGLTAGNQYSITMIALN